MKTRACTTVCQITWLAGGLLLLACYILLTVWFPGFLPSQLGSCPQGRTHTQTICQGLAITGALLGTHCQRVQHTHDVPCKVMAEKHSCRTRDPRVQSNHCGDGILPFRGRGCGSTFRGFWRTTSSSRAGFPAYTFRAVCTFGRSIACRSDAFLLKSVPVSYAVPA